MRSIGCSASSVIKAWTMRSRGEPVEVGLVATGLVRDVERALERVALRAMILLLPLSIVTNANLIF